MMKNCLEKLTKRLNKIKEEKDYIKNLYTKLSGQEELLIELLNEVKDFKEEGIADGNSESN
jgi:hypothetical protein